MPRTSTTESLYSGVSALPRLGSMPPSGEESVMGLEPYAGCVAHQLLSIRLRQLALSHNKSCRVVRRKIEAIESHRLMHALVGNMPPVVTQKLGLQPLYLGGGCTLWRSAGVGSKGRSSWLALAWNRLMHALNGNRKKTGNPSESKEVAKVAAKAAKVVKKELKKVAEEKPRAKIPKLKSEKKALGIRGRGDYELGTNIGSKIGGFLGGKLHEWIKKITGFGDYEIHGQPAQNSLLARDTVPTFASK